MKKILALLLLATLGRADVVGPMPMQLPASGGIWPISGSVTYALNNALTGAASSAIDSSGNNGIYLTVTGTANGLVTVWFSNSNVSPTTGALPAYQVQVPGNYYVPIKARYISLTNDTQKAGTRVTAFYYAATPSITVTTSGTTTVTGNVSITASVPLTVTASVVSNTSSYVSVSTSAYTVLSQTATVLNLTNVAATGSTSPCMICLASNGGAAAGFKVQFGTSATAPGNLTASSVGHYVAASTTSQCWGPFKAGGHAYLAGVAASSSVIFDIQQAQ